MIDGQLEHEKHLAEFLDQHGILTGKGIDAAHKEIRDLRSRLKACQDLVVRSREDGEWVMGLAISLERVLADSDETVKILRTNLHNCRNEVGRIRDELADATHEIAPRE